jgi:hypothetical protein
MATKDCVLGNDVDCLLRGYGGHFRAVQGFKYFGVSPPQTKTNQPG